MRACVYARVSSNRPQMREIHPSFRQNDGVCDQGLSDGRENLEPPEGHTVESWAAMVRVANVLGDAIGPLPPFRPMQAIEMLRDGKSYVYFIGGDHGCIKIGVSIAPHERVAQLSTGSPIPIRLLAKVEGARALEREYHARFAECRSHGEWFARHPDILAEIERLSA